LKTIKSPYLRNRLTDFDVIWQADAELVSYCHRPLIIQNFKLKMVDVSHCDTNRLANVKSKISQNSTWQQAAISKAINYYFN